ncbi:MAG: helix-turn-helix domain-containing protein [Microvirga sp.]
MQTLFSTNDLHSRDSFKRWQETLFNQGARVEQKRLDDGLFTATMEAAVIGSIAVSRVRLSALRIEAPPGMIRTAADEGRVMVTLQLAGAATADQDGRCSVQRPGDLVVISPRPTVLTMSEGSKCLSLQIPRERLENVLGSTQLYTALTVGSDLASVALVSVFFNELIRVQHELTPDSATRMASVGVDLIVASIADRMAKDVPRPIHGTVVVQRAKAFVEANLGDPNLDPPMLAAAVGVSLRRLQELFHERGQHISDWIWERRLATAANRLTDFGYLHMPLGNLAYGCGFASQSHFSRRFKERYELSPRDYRHRAISQAVAC